MSGRVITSSSVGSNTGLDATAQTPTTSTGASETVSDGTAPAVAASAAAPAAAAASVAYDARVEDEKLARSVYDLGVAGIPGLLAGDPSPARGLDTFSGGFGTTPLLVAALNKVAEELDLTPRVFNIKAYGAVGDGVTDDTAAIIAATAAAGAAGGEVLVPGGYTFAHASPIDLPSGIVFRGQGATSILKYTGSGAGSYGVRLLDATNTRVTQLQLQSASACEVGLAIRSAYRCDIDHVWIQRTAGSAYSIAGVYLYDNGSNNNAQVHLSSVHVQACAGDGVRIMDAVGAGGIFIHRSRLQGNSGRGLNQRRPSSAAKSEFHLLECDIEGNVLGQIAVDAAVNSSIENCHIENSDGSAVYPVFIASRTAGDGESGNGQVYAFRFLGNFVHAKNCDRAVVVNGSAAGAVMVDIVGNEFNNSLAGGATLAAISSVGWYDGRCANHYLGGFSGATKHLYDAGGSGNPGSIIQDSGSVQIGGYAAGAALGFYNKAPVAQATIAAAATDPATTQALANDLRAKLIALGLVK